MKTVYTYNQPVKISARHKSLFYAIDLLTSNRNKSCCIERNYVRRVYDYFMSVDDCMDKEEARKIDVHYINNWEKLHDSCVGYKRPEDLIVCYLAGPEPHNDFLELINLGILPQNIWAFENNLGTYQTALTSYNIGAYPQPKIIKLPIEHFFKQTPKKFDIVYIDACGAIPSSQHALRCVSSLCKYHRLNSPGILITNFSIPNIESEKVKEEYSNLLSLYFLPKEYPNVITSYENGKVISQEYDNIKAKVNSNISEYYGNFISSVLRDLSSTIIPVSRFANSSFLQLMTKWNVQKIDDPTIEIINSIQNNSLSKYFSLVHFLRKNDLLDIKTKSLINELQGVEEYPIDVCQSFLALFMLKTSNSILKEEIQVIRDYFEEKNNVYQFLDRTHSNLFFDLIINQIAYPMHYNTDAIRRFSYKAKNTQMYMDVTVLDECRYIYEWLPAVHQIKSAFNNLSWQYVFRFALDGLVKNRFNYNNEFFFQGSVISDVVPGFKNKVVLVREILY